MAQTAGYFHLHLISDATGETLITVARAVAAQYARVMPVEHMHPLVRTQKQLDRVLGEIEESPGIVLYTLLEEGLVERLEGKCRELGLPCLSILGPVLHLFQAYLGAESTHKVGAQHTLNAEYFRRIDALNYTMLHDDGQQTDDLEEADVILVGVSRTSKPRLRSIWPIAALRPQMYLWCPACRCPLKWSVSRIRWLSVSSPRPSASCRSGRIGCLGSRRTAMTISISTGWRSPKKLRRRGGCAPSTTGR